MATYTELYNELQEDAQLRDKVAIACCKKAQTIVDLSTPTADQLNWANAVLQNPAGAAMKLLPYVLAANSSATVAQIQSASDATIQTNVNAAADKLISGGLI